jgi:hypothetical protein
VPDVYIDTDNGGAGRDGSPGNPYNTWSEAWEAEDANIDPGETWNFFFRGTASDGSGILVLDGWPTVGAGDVTLNFYPWHTTFGAVSDADDGWYQGDDNWSTAHYRLDEGLSSNGRGVLEIEGDDETVDARVVRIQGLQFRADGISNVNSCIKILTTASGQVYIDGNRLSFPNTGTFPRPVSHNAATSTIEGFFRNNIITYNGDQLCSAFNINDSGSSFKIINNTVVYSHASGGEDFFDDVAGITVDAYNNVAYAAAGAGAIEFDNAGTLNHDFNASIVPADRGASGFDVATADFTDYGTADANELTPAASQTNAWGAGGVTQGDNALVPATDIRGNARNTGVGENTAIGAFAAVGEGAAPAGAPPRAQVWVF